MPRLLEVLSGLNQVMNRDIEAVFVIDGSPDRSFEILHDAFGELEFSAQLVAHSRNFGSFSAIRSGLSVARGDLFAVMSADLQEPPTLLIDFFSSLAQDECDVVIGTRAIRNDPYLSGLASRTFWSVYRRFVVEEMPEGGVDVFGCNRLFRDHLIKLGESRSSLIAQIFWLGFHRKFISYERLKRREGKSAWTFSKKI